MRGDVGPRSESVHRKTILGLLERHDPRDEHEAASLRRMEAFIRQHADCFERSLLIGHITGSAWLVNKDGTHVLLTHHRKLNMWLQLGGHADGDADVLAVAMREAQEESGIDAIAVISPEVFDVDVHRIPERKGVPAHDHYDMRFLLTTTGSERTQVSDESHELRWVSMDDLDAFDVDASVRRMGAKWIQFRKTPALSLHGASSD